MYCAQYRYSSGVEIYQTGGRAVENHGALKPMSLPEGGRIGRCPLA